MSVVLAAIDASTSTPAVLATAVAVADLFDATPTALHVRENDSTAAFDAASGLGIDFRETVGPTVATIVDAATSPDVLAVVLGARGEHDGSQAAGHTALEVITRVAKPTIVVPRDCPTPSTIRRILTPLEGTSETSEAIAETLRRACNCEVDIFVLHVHTPETVPPFQDQPHHAIPVWEREFAARFIAVPRAQVNIVQRVGEVSAHVLEVAGEIGADLVAFGWNQILEPGRARVVRHALTHSTLPVLLVPTP